jgi:hypothetical protein
MNIIDTDKVWRRLFDKAPKIGRLASPHVRWAIVLMTTALGAAWLYYKGPVPIVRVTTPLQEPVPFWYMLSAFPVLGMLAADLAFLFVSHGLERKTVELGFQVGILVLASNLRLVLRLPISGHSLLFAYFILRRLFIGIPGHSLAKAECLVTMFLYTITSYVKVFWWSDPITVAVGTGIAIGLAAISFCVLKSYKADSIG